MQRIATNLVPEPIRALLDGILGQHWRAGTLQLLPGTTNWVARLAYGGQRMVLRLPHLEDAVLRVDRDSECAALAAVAQADIGPEVMAGEPSSGALITRWIDGQTWTREQAAEPANIERMGRLLRRLHEVPVPAGVRQVDLLQIVDHYLAVLRRDAARDLHCLAELRAGAIRRLTESDCGRGAVLCHNDAHHLNIIGSRELKLIDWEYAGIGDPLFDLAAYARYHDLDSSAVTHLLEACGMSAGAIGLADFAAVSWLFDYVWALWLVVSGPADGAHEGAPPGQLQRLLARLAAAG